MDPHDWIDDHNFYKGYVVLPRFVCNYECDVDRILIMDSLGVITSFHAACNADGTSVPPRKSSEKPVPFGISRAIAAPHIPTVAQQLMDSDIFEDVPEFRSPTK